MDEDVRAVASVNREEREEFNAEEERGPQRARRVERRRRDYNPIVS